MSIFHSHDPSLAVEKLNCRLSVFGAGGVGKTKMVERLIHGTYTDRYRPTVEDYHERVQKFQGVSLTIEIVDTSGTNQFPDMRKLNIRQSNLLLLVYDVSQPRTFEEVKRLYDIARQISNDCVIVIVGAKCDLLPTETMCKHGGTDIATKFLTEKQDVYSFHRLCSAKMDTDMDTLLQTALSSLFPDIIKRHETCTTAWCTFRQHNVANKFHAPESRYGVRCMCRQMAAYVVNKLHLEER